MNYLAHAYLSFNRPGLVIGNMISDYVKGKRQYEYEPDILAGIKLHRAIDTFTDAHAVTYEAKQYFRKDYRLYAGAFVDVVYDHYLATDNKIFSTQKDLQQTATYTYEILKKNRSVLPAPFAAMLPYMESQNWLVNYQSREGIEKSLMGVVRRSKYLKESAIAFSIFEANYDALKHCYEAFFPELKTMVQLWIEALDTSGL